MKTSTKWLGLILLALTGCKGTTVPASAQDDLAPQNSPLDLYLDKAEPNFKWEVAPGQNAAKNEVNLRLTSQTWQGNDWRHRVQMFLPEATADTEVIPDAAVIWVTYGDGSMGESMLAQSLTRATGAISVNLFNVPNQPLYGRNEDALIAYTLARFLETRDPSWPLLFPMTKSVIKAMDAVSDWSEKTRGQKINRFIITGASKRGWTSYLTAAGDKRVVGIVPVVYDNLNMVEQLRNQGQIWTGISEQMRDYSALDLPRQAETPEGRALIAGIDPYAFRNRLTMPKLLINATNDRFWPHNALKFYGNELPRPWNVFYVPNAGHTLGAGQLNAGLAAAAWSRRILRDGAVPEVRLESELANGKRVFTVALHGNTEEELGAAKLWYASAPTADLREARWQSVAMTARRGIVNAELPPTQGYTAVFAEVELGDQRLPLRLSSPMWESTDQPGGGQ